MKILVTGSNGLLGQKLISLLGKEKDVEVIATARGENRIPVTFENVSYYPMDITIEGEVYNVIDKTKPDVIINTAAMTNVDQCETDRELCTKLNVDAVSYLIKAAENNQAFLLHLSTDFIFDGISGPYPEEAEANPLSFYGQSKLDAEKLILQSNIDWAIARTVLVYGIAHDMSRSNIILWVKSSLENNKNIKVVDDQWRSPTLAEDLAMGCYLIARNKAKGIFNISGKDMLTPYDMAIMTADYFGLDKSLITKVDSTIFTQPAKRPPKTGFIIDKAKKELGYAPHSFQEGIELLARQLTEASSGKA